LPQNYQIFHRHLWFSEILSGFRKNASNLSDCEENKFFLQGYQKNIVQFQKYPYYHTEHVGISWGGGVEGSIRPKH